MAKHQSKPSDKATAPKKKRTRISQSDVPIYTLDEALRVPRAILENYAGRPATPLQVAQALNMAPTSGSFKNLCGSSIAYGLTQGGYNAKEISVEAIAKRIVQPTVEDDDVVAKREAILKPRVLGEFVRKYEGSPLPRHDIALNMLVEIGVPKERAESVYTLIIDSSQSVGFFREIKGKQYVDLTGVPKASESSSENTAAEQADMTPQDASKAEFPTTRVSEDAVDPTATPPTSLNKRVFITHGKNKGFVDPIKKLLGFGELEAVVAVERQSVSKPVPDKVMDDMRSCSAAIIHVEDEMKLIDQEANEHVIINPNVLLEIGAAMALYGRRFVLLVKEGVKLPSNLQGLYEVRYAGDNLDGNATIKLLEAINDIKNNPLPTRA